MVPTYEHLHAYVPESTAMEQMNLKCGEEVFYDIKSCSPSAKSSACAASLAMKAAAIWAFVKCRLSRHIEYNVNGPHTAAYKCWPCRGMPGHT